MEDVINKLREYFNDNCFIDDDILKQYITELIYQEQVQDYVTNVSINYDEGSGYNNISHEIIINPIELLAKMPKLDFEVITMDKLITDIERKMKVVLNVNKINIHNIFQSNHELTHAFQNIIYDEGSIEDWYTGLLSKCLILMSIDEKYFDCKYYNMFHEEFFSEYDANINSYIMTLSLLNGINLKKLDKLIEKFNMIIAKNILSLYRNIFNKNELSTPSLNTVRLFNMLKEQIRKLDPEEYEKIYSYEKHAYDSIRHLPKPKDQFSRLELGLSLKRETLTYIYNISNGNKKTLNLFDDIKNISLF